MKLLLLGATGRAGQLVMAEALVRGHTVTAIVRAPERVQSQDRLHIVVGDPLSANLLAPLLRDHEVVISCLGQRSRRDANLLSEAAAAMLEAMGRTGARRWLVISQGLLFPSRNPLIALLRIILARHVGDSGRMERLVQASDTDWTIVRPPRLVEGGARRGYRVAVGASPQRGWAMNYGDLASYLVDEAERRQHPKAIIGIASALSACGSTEHQQLRAVSRVARMAKVANADDTVAGPIQQHGAAMTLIGAAILLAWAGLQWLTG
jgi:putative NADH-flavin reductase